MTRAPAARASFALSSSEPLSTTRISPAIRFASRAAFACETHSPIVSASFKQGMTTETRGRSGNESEESRRSAETLSCVFSYDKCLCCDPNELVAASRTVRSRHQYARSAGDGRTGEAHAELSPRLERLSSRSAETAGGDAKGTSRLSRHPIP